MVWIGTHFSIIILNRTAVFSNLYEGVTNLSASFEVNIFLPAESGRVPFDKFLLPMSSYPPHNEYSPIDACGGFS